MSNEERREERQREKDQAAATIEQALSTIDAGARESDSWERSLIIRAVGCVFRVPIGRRP
jgi:hypothetical protein